MKFKKNYHMNNKKENTAKLDAKPESRASLGFWVNLGSPQFKHAPLLYT